MERVNARTLDAGTLPEPADLAVIDVAFISLALVLGPIRSVVRDDAGPIVALVKPQFEAGRADAKGGVVRDPEIHRRVLRATVAATAATLGSGRVTSSRRRSRGPRATASSSPGLLAGRVVRGLDARIDAAVDRAWEHEA